MPHRGTETQFELTTIERLEGQGYMHLLRPRPGAAARGGGAAGCPARVPGRTLPLTCHPQPGRGRGADQPAYGRGHAAPQHGLPPDARPRPGVEGRVPRWPGRAPPDLRRGLGAPGRQHLQRRQPVARPRPERPPPRPGALRQRPAAGPLRAEEPLLGEAHRRRGAEPGPPLHPRNPADLRLQRVGRRLRRRDHPARHVDRARRVVRAVEVHQRPRRRAEHHRQHEGAGRGAAAQGSAAGVHPGLHRLRGRQREDHEKGRALPPVLRRPPGRGESDRDLSQSARRWAWPRPTGGWA